MTGLLIFIGLILIVLNSLAIKKQSKSFKGTLGNAIEDMTDYDVKFGEIRREFSESILELQREMLDIKEILQGNVDLNIIADEKKQYISPSFNNEQDMESFTGNSKATNFVDNNKENQEEKKKSAIKNNDNSVKIEEIKKLFNEGLSAQQVSEQLHLGKGEVLLIKDLYIR